MSAFDTAKEVVRMASTAGLSKDVIDLMEKKIALLTGEIADLLAEISILQAEVSGLKIFNGVVGKAALKPPQSRRLAFAMRITNLAKRLDSESRRE